MLGEGRGRHSVEITGEEEPNVPGIYGIIDTCLDAKGNPGFSGELGKFVESYVRTVDREG